MQTSYDSQWVWFSIALTALLAAAAGFSLLWSRTLSNRFRISMERLKMILSVAALCLEFFSYQQPSMITIFCVVLFITGYLSNSAYHKPE